jgi:hypothetical protein
MLFFTDLIRWKVSALRRPPLFVHAAIYSPVPSLRNSLFYALDVGHEKASLEALMEAPLYSSTGLTVRTGLPYSISLDKGSLMA